MHTVVVSVQHSEKITLDDLRADVMEKVVKAVIPDRYLDERTVYHINPCGEFVLGGPKVNEIHVFCSSSQPTVGEKSCYHLAMYLIERDLYL